MLDHQRDEIGAIARLKVGQITQWRSERLTFARVLFADPRSVSEVEDYLAGRATPADRARLERWLVTAATTDEAQGVCLFDKAGTRVFESAPHEVGPVDRAEVTEALRTGVTCLTDLYLDGEGKSWIDLVVPVGAPGHPAIGVALFPRDPNLFLYSLIQTWPTPSTSAESLLVRRDGRDVLYLNTLRHRKGTALRLRLPLNKARLPASEAVQGKTGVVEGIDYRGVPVLADLRGVPGTGWKLVSKVDLAEVLDPIRAIAWSTLLVVALLLLVSGLVFGYLRSRQGRAYLRMRAEAERADKDHLEKTVRERTADLERLNEELRVATEAKSRFLASMSHELRTPLNSIIGFTGILLQGLAGELNDEQAKQMHMVEGSGKRLLALIDDVLDLSRIEAGRSEVVSVEFDPAEMVDSVVSAIRPLAEERGLDLRVEVADGVGTTSTDIGKVRQILTNLLSNAVKFTQRGGIVVSVAPATGDRLVFSVSDTGAGISADEIEAIFDEFTQGRAGAEVLQGTGLGLAISRKLARMLGGDLAVRSELGKGSTFTLTLPRRLASDPGR